jgi:hypothetical protein
MDVRRDCRHYSTRTTATGEVVQRCRVEMNETAPFRCPDHCLFFEGRSLAGGSWPRFPDDPPGHPSGGPTGPGR